MKTKRKKKGKFCLFNITMHPHSPDLYEKLLTDIFQSKTSNSAYGRVYRLAELNRIDKDHFSMVGKIARYVDFDPKKPWANTENMKAIESDKVPFIFQLNNLRPGYAETLFAWYAPRHTLVADCTFVSVNTIQKVLQGMLSNHLSAGSFWVQPIQECTELKQILDSPRLSSIEIELYRPNGDIISGDPQPTESMREQNLKKIVLKYEALTKEGIKPNENTRRFCALSLSYGVVRAIVWTRGNAQKFFSTHKFPVIREFTAGSSSSFENMLARSKEEIDKIERNEKGDSEQD